MEIDKSIKVGDIVATNASNTGPFVGQRLFGEVSRIDFNGIHKGFEVDLKLNKNVFNGFISMCAYPFDEPGRPYEDAYLVKATPEECEAHRTGVMPTENDPWCIQVTEGNRDLLNEYMKPLLVKYGKPKSWEVRIGTYFTCPDKWTRQHSYLSPLKETRVITTEEFIEKTEMKKKSEFKYKKGVWYRHKSDDSFRKCSKDSNNIIRYEERIVGKQYEIHTGTAHWNGIEADIDEYSRYLPDGHPDKIEEKNLKASEEFHDFQIGQKFEILVDKPHSAGLKKGDIVTCCSVYKGTINVRKDGVAGKPINWTLDKSTIGEYYEPYYGGGGIVEQIKSSKDEEYSPLEESEYSFGFIDQSQYRSGYDPVEEPKSMISKNDTFDPIVKAPIVI